MSRLAWVLLSFGSLTATAVSCDVYSPDLLSENSSRTPGDAGKADSGSGGKGSAGSSSGNSGNSSSAADGGSTSNPSDAGMSTNDAGPDASAMDADGGSGGGTSLGDAGIGGSNAAGGAGGNTSTNPGGTSNGGAGGEPGGGMGGSVVVVPDKPDTLIEDLEDANTQIHVVQPRNGYWFSYTTATGNVTAPGDVATCLTGLAGCGSGEDGPPGVNNNRYAAHLVAENITGDGAGIGFSFRAGTAMPYDASAYTGLVFWAKAASASSGDVIFAVTTAATETVCTVCGDHFAVGFSVPTTWTRLEIPFSVLTQIGGFGDAASFAANQVVAFQIQTMTNADFDIWIDEVYFTE